jgi:hypothetical protein
MKIQGFPILGKEVTVRNIARQMRYFDASFDNALDLVLTGHCSVY